MSDRGSYIRAVEAHFLKYRGTGFVLSPKDEALVDSWYQKKIPLQSILRGLDEAVVEMRDRESRMHFKPRSISYFARSVEAHSNLPLASMTSTLKGTQTVAEEQECLKDKLLQELQSLNARLGPREADQLLSMREELSSASDETLWGRLPVMEADLDRLLIAWLPDGEREVLEEQAQERVRRECGPYLSPKARQEQEEEALAVLSRAHFGFEGLMSVATGATKSRD